MGGGRQNWQRVLATLFYKMSQIRKRVKLVAYNASFSFPFFCLFLFATIQFSNQKTIPRLKRYCGGGGISPPCPPQVTPMWPTLFPSFLGNDIKIKRDLVFSQRYWRISPSSGIRRCSVYYLPTYQCKGVISPETEISYENPSTIGNISNTEEPERTVNWHVH
jgi:hypothetical protein